ARSFMISERRKRRSWSGTGSDVTVRRAVMARGHVKSREGSAHFPSARIDSTYHWCAMPSYRYCFLDSADCIAELQVIAGRTDGEAQTVLTAYSPRNYHGIEVWDRGRHVYRARKAAASN